MSDDVMHALSPAARRYSLTPLVTLLSANFINEITSCRLMWTLKQWTPEHNITQDKKAALPPGNRAMPQLFFQFKVCQRHSLQG